MATGYRKIIRDCLDGRGNDARHIEAFMRLELGALDHLPRSVFQEYTEMGVLFVDQVGVAGAEALACSYGL